MKNKQINFTNGGAYERYMGKWSQLVGEQFLAWLAPVAQQRWLDVGCGNGAFTQMLVEQCAPATVHGIDPSEEQLAYARSRAALDAVQLQLGDAMALPYADDVFDVAVMPLVIFFVPEPAKGVAEMVRVVGTGGVVAAYAWDMPGGGFPYEVLLSEIRGLGFTVPEPPSPDASRLDVLQVLWEGAGLQAIETLTITAYREFADFEDFWTTALGAPSVGPTLAKMAPEHLAVLKDRISQRLPSDATGRVVYGARANAVKGRVT